MPKILVIDDDEDLLMGLIAMFTKEQFTVGVMSKAEDTFAKIYSFQPDIILLDVELNDSDGRNICRKIKQNDPTLHIPVVMMSGNQLPDNTIKEIGASAFLMKPFAVPAMIDTIRSLLLLPVD